MTQLFWQLYIYGMVGTFFLFPFVDAKSGGLNSPLDVKARELIVAILIGVIPLLNIGVALLCLLSLVAHLVWEVFTGDWGNISLRSAFKKDKRN